MTIPIANPIITEAAHKAVSDVLDSGMIADGEKVRTFESEFAKYVGTDHAIATASGTAALHAMLATAGIGEGDTVVTTPFSFISTANAIKHAGATPVFADISPKTYNIEPSAVRELVERRSDVAAILPVHLYGLAADMDPLRRIAIENDLTLFEDAAQAHGARYNGTPVGAIGDAAAFSFYPTKNMTTGEGGMITTDDTDLAERIRCFIDHGRTGRYEHERVGYNYRMTNIAAAIGIDQLRHLPDWVETRQSNAEQLTEQLASADSVTTPECPDNHQHAYHQYTIRVSNRAQLIGALDDADIGYGIYYPETIPGQPVYGERRGWNTAERATSKVVSLPVHPALSPAQVDEVASVVRSEVKA